MSRVGFNPISIPEGVQYTFIEQLFSVTNQKANLSLKLDIGFNIIEQDGDLIIKRPDDTKNVKAKHGLYRSLIANMFEGLSKGFKKELELHGVGYRASNSGQKLDLSLGYSHNIVLEICNEVLLKTETENILIPIHAYPVLDRENLRNIFPKLIDFGTIEVGETVSRR